MTVYTLLDYMYIEMESEYIGHWYIHFFCLRDENVVFQM